MGTHNQERRTVGTYSRERELQARCDRLTTEAMALSERVAELERRLADVSARLDELLTQCGAQVHAEDKILAEGSV